MWLTFSLVVDPRALRLADELVANVHVLPGGERLKLQRAASCFGYRVHPIKAIP